MKKERTHDREVSIESATTYEPTREFPTLRLDAKILNVSKSGACIFSERAFESGRYLRLKLPQADRAKNISRLAEVMWVASYDGGFKMGLRFRG
jgi:hypothetical protein